MIREDELEWAFKKLEFIGQKLNMLSTVLLTATMINFGLICSIFSRVISTPPSMITSVLMASTFSVFFLALWFDTLRKDGKSYYDEISGVLHANAKNMDMDIATDSIMARIAMRKFISSYEIPLIPGKYGPGAIFMINVIIVVFWVIFSPSLYF